MGTAASVAISGRGEGGVWLGGCLPGGSAPGVSAQEGAWLGCVCLGGGVRSLPGWSLPRGCLSVGVHPPHEQNDWQTGW